ncbi:MAG: hypothetical protein FJ030_02840 [Chloroflexi bacterium]|nr:hypothetical protein [Chloroflexota bacterium]
MATTYDFVRLAEREDVRGRPFADASHSADDLRALQSIAARLADMLSGSDPQPLHVETHDPNGRCLRVIVSRPEMLATDRDLVFVGFFGQRRANADPAPIDEVDRTLVAEFAAYPEILSYCSLELENGNYGNLVLLAHDGAREHWRESARHQYAVAELAPSYYASVRLHSGAVVGRLRGRNFRFRRTKYFDYQNGFWCALREPALLLPLRHNLPAFDHGLH